MQRSQGTLMRRKTSKLYPPDAPTTVEFVKMESPGKIILVCETRYFPKAMILRQVIDTRDWETTLNERYYRIMGDFVKRALSKASVTTSRTHAAADEVFGSEYPALLEFLTLQRDDDGKARQTATVNIFAQDGHFKAFLNERQSGRSMCVAAKTIEELYACLEAELCSDNPGWRERMDDGTTRRTKR